MNARTVQTAAMAISVLFVPISIGRSRLIEGSKLLSISFLVVLYASVLAALFSTFVRYRNEQQSSLARWRRMPYITGVLLLFALCLCPIATWPIALSRVTLHIRLAILCLLGVNAAAAILVWFGSGWSRLGLTVVAYWIGFLWLFPLAMQPLPTTIQDILRLTQLGQQTAASAILMFLAVIFLAGVAVGGVFTYRAMRRKRKP